MSPHDASPALPCRLDPDCDTESPLHSTSDRPDTSSLPDPISGSFGGLGGHDFFDTEPGRDHRPVVFVHGNRHDAHDFTALADRLLDAGYRGDALWAITFSERTPRHGLMKDELDSFVTDVLDYTDADAIDLVAHSLGVTGARYWLSDRDRTDSVATLVGLAGPNHGTHLCSLCPTYTGKCKPCRFISPIQRVPPLGRLHRLNHPDETPGDTDYYTIRATDDPYFPVNPQSPCLDGATNVAIETDDHMAVLLGDEALDSVENWLTDQ